MTFEISDDNELEMNIETIWSVDDYAEDILEALVSAECEIGYYVNQYEANFCEITEMYL